MPQGMSCVYETTLRPGVYSLLEWLKQDAGWEQAESHAAQVLFLSTLTPEQGEDPETGAAEGEATQAECGNAPAVAAPTAGMFW